MEGLHEELVVVVLLDPVEGVELLERLVVGGQDEAEEGGVGGGLLDEFGEFLRGEADEVGAEEGLQVLGGDFVLGVGDVHEEQLRVDLVVVHEYLPHDLQVLLRLQRVQDDLLQHLH